MPAKITGLTLDYRSCCPKVTVAGQTSLLSCRKARKARIFTSDWEPSGESRFDARNRCAAGAYELIAAAADPPKYLCSPPVRSLRWRSRRASSSLRAKFARVSSRCHASSCCLLCPRLSVRRSLAAAKVNVAVEAGIRQGWDAIIGSAGTFVGMTGFGASAPYKDLYRHFGLTAEKVAEAASSKV